jgi:glycolate oxidase iron-sulfur subunit
LAVCVHPPTPQPAVHLDRNNEDPRARILRQADTCVKCGLCLPHCPTYRLSSDEAESPRGRTSLIQGWLGGDLPGDGRLFGHLDRCLECGACEQACPSLVPFVEILDAAKAERLNDLPPTHWGLRRWVLGHLADPRLPHRLSKIYRGTGLATLLHRWFRLSDGLGHLERLGRGMANPAIGPSADSATPSVSLFTGCVARHLDAEAQAAMLRVLGRLGYSVHIPPETHCCGALHRHDGFESAAQLRLNASRSRFATAERNPVLCLASACTAELRRDAELSAQVYDACRFLADLRWPDNLRPRPYNGRVLVHVPCSQANLLRDPGAAFDLLRLIPDIELRELADNPVCCGAAGAYLLREPTISRQLLQAKLTQLPDSGADVLVTTNTGCAAHLRAGIEQAGLDIEVCHPVELLERQLPT